MQKRSYLDRIYILILLLFSIEYVGDGMISVYRLAIFPLSIVGLILFLSKRTVVKNSGTIILFIILMLWFTFARLYVDDNWLFPLFNIPLGVFLFLYYNHSPETIVKYSRIFSIYSLPHIFALVFGFANWKETQFAGLHDDPNFCSINLVIAILASLFLMMDRDERIVFKMYAFLNIIVSSILLFLAGSRGGILSLILIVLYLILISGTKLKVKILFFIVVAIGLNYLHSYIDSLPDWVNPETEPVDAFLSRLKPEALSTGSGRDEIWTHVWKKIEENNSIIMPVGRKAAMAGVRNEYTHNTFLDFLVENGTLIGIIDLLIIVFAIIRTIIYQIKGYLSKNNFVFTLLALSLMSQLFVLSAISDKIFWLMVVFLMSLPVLKTKNKDCLLKASHK